MAHPLRSLSIRATVSLILASLAALLVIIAVTDVLDAMGRGARLASAADNARASRDLFRALADLRSERANLNGFLQGPNPVGSAEFEQRVTVPRAASQAAHSAAVAELKGVGVAGLSAALETLRTSQAAVADLRVKADAAARLPRAQRDAAVVDAWPGTTQRYLDALGAVSDIVDSATALSDPLIAHYLSIKRAAWAGRLGNGGFGFRIGSALAAKRGWTPAEAAAAREDRGRSLAAWDLMAQAAARPDAPAALREAIAKAATNFVGASYEIDRGIMETLSAGTPSAVESSELGKRYAVDQWLIVNVAIVAADLMVAEAEAQLARARSAVLWTSTLLIVGLITTGIGFLVLRRRVTQPLAALASAMRALAARNTTIDIPGMGRRDEIGLMAASVAVFRDDIRERERLAAVAESEQEAKVARAARIEAAMAGFERQAASLAGAVSDQAAQLNNAANTMNTVAERTGRGATDVAQSANEASTDIQTVATATEQLSASIREISGQVANSATVASEVSETAGQSDQAMKALTEAAGRIGEVVNVIGAITGQINLLALNATIEAARAGESGKGFAVVAGEVKALAQRTERATSEIGSHIQHIQGATSTMALVIDNLVRSVGTMREIATSVSAAVEEQSAATDEIAHAVQRTVTATGAVTRSIGQVSVTAGQTGEAGRSVLDASIDLASNADRLSKEVATFKRELQAA